MTLSLAELRDRIAAARAMDAPVLLLPDEAEALAGRVALEEMTYGAALIATERLRQISGEGWTAEHDAEHDRGELATAAACYALPEHERAELPRYEAKLGGDGSPKLWPWGGYWNPTPDDRVRELVRAGALIAAEIDRLSPEAS